MNPKLFKSFTPALVGAVTLAVVGIPQAAEAGTVTGSSNVRFTDVSLELIDNDDSGNGIANLWDISFATVSAGGEINGSDPTVGLGPVSTDTPIDTRSLGQLPFVVGANEVDGAAAVDLSNPLGITSNEASIFLTGDGPVSGSGFGQYTVFSDDFTVTSGDELDLNGSFQGIIEGEITDFTGGTKIVESNYVARYDVFLDDELVFSGDVLDAANRVINENGEYSEDTGIIPIDDTDYTFENGGTARVEFFAREEASATIDRDVQVPEPASILGLLAVGGAFGFLKRRRSHQ